MNSNRNRLYVGSTAFKSGTTKRILGMYATSRILALLLIAVSSAGCAICCGPDDYNYGTYGGLHDRMDRRYGRVGSIFSDPNGTAIRLSPHAELPDSYQAQPIEEPSDANEDRSDLPSAEELPRANDDDQNANGVDTVRGVRYRRPGRPALLPGQRSAPTTPSTIPMNNTPIRTNPNTIPARPINNHQSRSFLGGGRYR